VILYYEKKLITDEMIQEFNEVLIKEGSILRLEKGKGTMGIKL